MTVKIIPEVSEDQENLLKRISELVRKEVKFDKEAKTRKVQDVIQRVHESLFQGCYGNASPRKCLKNRLLKLVYCCLLST